MNNTKEMWALKRELRREKAKAGMPLKKKLFYGISLGLAAIVAIICISFSLGKDTYNPKPVFDIHTYGTLAAGEPVHTNYGSANLAKTAYDAPMIYSDKK